MGYVVSGCDSVEEAVVLTGNNQEEDKQQLWWTSTGGRWRELFFRNNFHIWENLGHHLFSGKTPISHRVCCLFAGQSCSKQVKTT